jgi:hypothetical protein
LCLVLAGKEKEVPTLLESYNYRQLLLSKISFGDNGLEFRG